MGAIPDLCEPVAVLPGDHPGCLFEGNRAGYPLASDAGACRLRGIDDVFEFPEISKKTEINCKFEARNPKFETNPNEQSTKLF
jgi:hypothetical protein